MSANAITAIPERQQPLSPNTSGFQEPSLSELDTHLLLAEPDEPVEPLISGFINMPKGEVTGLIGDSGVGKSWFVCDMLMCLALGRPFLGQPTKQVRCLYITFEQSLARDRERFHRLARGHGTTMQEVSTHFDYKNLTSHAGRLLKLEDELQAALEVTGAEFLVIDAFSSASGVDSNNEAEVQQVYSMLKRLAKGMRTILVLVHPSRNRRNLDAQHMEASGSVQHRAQVRVAYAITASSNTNGVLVFGMSKANDSALESRKVRRLGTFEDDWLRHELIDDTGGDEAEEGTAEPAKDDNSSLRGDAEVVYQLLCIGNHHTLAELVSKVAEKLGIAESTAKRKLEGSDGILRQLTDAGKITSFKPSDDKRRTYYRAVFRVKLQ